MLLHNNVRVAPATD